MAKPEWIGQCPGQSDIAPYSAELTGDTIHWKCDGDYDYRISQIDIRQSVADFKRFGSPDGDIPDQLVRDVADHLGITGDAEPIWLKPGEEGVFELVAAAAKGDVAKVELLRELINSPSPLGETAVIQSLGHPVAVLKTLLAHGANPDLAVKAGETALMTACERGLDRHVRALLKAGTDITLRDNRGRSALQYACYAGKRVCAELVFHRSLEQGHSVTHTEVIAALIGKMPSLAEEMVRRFPVTADIDLLFAAIRGGSIPLCKLALDAAVDPDVRESGDFEITPLIAAVQLAAREEFVSELLKRGADLNASDNRGASALAWSCKAGYRSMLLAAGANPDGRCHGEPGYTLLYKLCDDKAPLDEIRQLLQAGANPNAGQPDNQMPLHCAAGNGNVALVKLLLKHGADPAVADGNGHTSLWWSSNAAVTKLLQEKLRTTGS